MNPASPRTAPGHHDKRENLQGIFWMIASMAAFALEDAFVKTVTRVFPIGQLLMMFGLGGMLVFAAFPRRGGIGLLHAAVLSRAMLARAAFEFIGRLFYVLAIALTPLSSATAILQATPVLVVLGGSIYCNRSIFPIIAGMT